MSNITFNPSSKTDQINSLLDLSENFMNTEVTVDESVTDLNTIDYHDENPADITFVEPSTQPNAISDENLYDHIILFLSENPSIVTALHKGVNQVTLDLISEGIDYNITKAYKEDENLNILINAIAQGIIVGDKFQSLIPNTIKIFYITPDLVESIHHRQVSGIHLYKSTPAITEFTEDSINSLGAIYKNHKQAYASIYDFIKAECHKPIEESSDKFPILSFDNNTIAKSLAKSNKGIESGLAKLKAEGCPQDRLTQISILAKAYSDINKKQGI